MSFTSLTKPTQGDATKKSLADGIIDNLNDLNTRLLAFGTISGLKNGSFESDADSDGIPDSWTRTLYTGGSFTHDTTDQQHGGKAAKFTSPGGGGNGGGYLETTDFFEVSPLLMYRVEWMFYSSAAGVCNRVEIQFYTSAQASISTTTLYDSTTNPTAWTLRSARARPPATARYAKVRLIGCHTSSTTAGSTWFDNVTITAKDFFQTLEFTATDSWRCPVGVTLARITCIGGGGGGSTSGGGFGGGGAGVARSITTVTPGTDYTVTIGGGGVAGSNGGNSTMNGVTGGGGQAGNAGGNGGTGTGDETWTGEQSAATIPGFAYLDDMEIHQYGFGGVDLGAGNSGKIILEF